MSENIQFQVDGIIGATFTSPDGDPFVLLDPTEWIIRERQRLNLAGLCIATLGNMEVTSPEDAAEVAALTEAYRAQEAMLQGFLQFFHPAVMHGMTIHADAMSAGFSMDGIEPEDFLG